MKESICFLILLLLLPKQIQINHLPRLIVWNVGQGLWVSIYEQKTCTHFDAGGEFYPKKVRELCKHKENLFYFSHWDWDHISFTYRAARELSKVCYQRLPGGKAKFGKEKRFKNWQPCTRNQSSVNEIYSGQNLASSNASSRIFLYQQKILLPGDAPISSERLWAHRVPKKLRAWLLGHHGSNTSSGKELLKQIQTADHAIASAREQKYFHPHPKVQKRLQDFHHNLLRTEDWGNIHIYF